MKKDLGEAADRNGAPPPRAAAPISLVAAAVLLPQKRPAALAVLDTNERAMCRLTPAIAPADSQEFSNRMRRTRSPDSQDGEGLGFKE